MANIRLHSDGLTSITCVPNVFIDEYMTSANGEFVKIYLYLLRCVNAPDKSLSISELADKFEHTEKDILRALTYWEKVHLLHLEFDSEKNLTGLYLSDSAPSCGENLKPQESTLSSNEVSDVALPETAIPAVTSSEDSASLIKDSYTSEQITNFQKNESVQEILFITESYLGRPLNVTETRTILYWFDGLNFSTDLIEYLIETCVGNGHKSLRYMEKIALSWAESNITTVAEARKEHSMHHRSAYSVMKSFGITGRNLIPVEIDMIQKWTDNYAFSMDIIDEACKRTITATGKASFDYAHTILTNWHHNNVHTLKDIAKLDAAHQKSKVSTKSQETANRPASTGNRFNNFPQRTYNYDQLEKKLLNSTSQS